MEKVTDWNALWRELVEVRACDRHRRFEAGADGKVADPWADRARKFLQGVNERWKDADSSRRFILSQLDADSTVLDIGAGAGAWATLLAGKAKSVTALDPSAAMLAVLREDMEARGISNIDVVQGSWPETDVAPHDFSLCSHAMYGCADLAGFIRKMEARTRKLCFLVLRAPAIDGVQAEAALRVWGQPLDSPNFTIAYNVLMQMGVYANVLMEDTGFWKPRTSPSLEAARERLKRGLGLFGVDAHDGFLTELLQRRLSWRDGVYVWPREVRSALVYWSPAGQGG
ncbi:MAG: class I SAM-dependent methyltransferase [Acidobacteriota bacterium]|jgi:2-polyprenyl-3-methyl-5-hydroxy-6-metoxy-1,4-benzoquinol methylase|nr:class I SAM-dependent methyltransferase [Acidobacteriota bacterium]